MKFQIWCVVHEAAVIATDSDANLTVKVPMEMQGSMQFEIDESNLYCTMEGSKHEFLIRVSGSDVILDEPGRIVP